MALGPSFLGHIALSLYLAVYAHAPAHPPDTGLVHRAHSLGQKLGRPHPWPWAFLLCFTAFVQLLALETAGTFSGPGACSPLQPAWQVRSARELMSPGSSPQPINTVMGI